MRYRKFVGIQYSVLKDLLSKMQKEPESKVPASKQTEFYKSHHDYLTSLEYRMSCMSFFPNTSFTEAHLHICFNITVSIRTYLMRKLVELLPVPKRDISSRCVTNASLARVRYVGGFCIAKTHYEYSQKKKTTMYKTDAYSVSSYEESLKCVNILSQLKVSEQYIISSTIYPESLIDVERRQTSRSRSLTNISDSLFEFFKNLTELTLKLLNNENLNKYGEKLAEYAQSEILNNIKLKEQFNIVVKESMTNEEDYSQRYCEEVFRRILKKYFMVMFKSI